MAENVGIEMPSILMRFRQTPVARRRSRIHEDRQNRDGVAGLMEVLEAHGIVPDLIQIGASEMLLSDFELDHKHHRPGHDNRVNTFAHPRDIELQKQRPIETLK